MHVNLTPEVQKLVVRIRDQCVPDGRAQLLRFVCGILWQVLLAFVDNWQQTGGVDEYVKWTGDPTKTHKDFYTDPTIMGWCAGTWLPLVPPSA